MIETEGPRPGAWSGKRAAFWTRERGTRFAFATMQSWCLLNIDKREQHVSRNKLGEFMHCTYPDILFVHLLRLTVEISGEGEDQPR